MNEMGLFTDAGNPVFAWLKDHATSETLTFAIGCLFVVCLYGVADGKRLNLKLGPMQLDLF